MATKKETLLLPPPKVKTASQIETTIPCTRIKLIGTLCLFVFFEKLMVKFLAEQ